MCENGAAFSHTFQLEHTSSTEVYDLEHIPFTACLYRINIVNYFRSHFDFSFLFFTLTCNLEGGKMESFTCK